MKQFLSVFKFEFKNTTSKKFYIVFTLLVALGIILAFTIPPIVSNVKESSQTSEGQKAENEKKLKKVVISDKSGLYGNISIFQKAVTGGNYEFIKDNSATEESLKQQIKDEKIYSALIIKDALNSVYLGTQNLNETLMPQLEVILQSNYKVVKMSEYGMNTQQISSIMQAPKIDFHEVGKNFQNTYWYTYVLLMVLFISISIYGQLVASSVASEKSSRAMELLITSAKPVNMMFGKVFGVGLSGFIQMLIFLFSAFFSYKANEAYWAKNEIFKSVFNMSGQIFTYTVICYLLGFFIFAVLFGAVGSLVSKIEDINIVSGPIIILLMFAFFVAMFSMVGGSSTVNSLFVVVCSFIPFFAPMVMFVRICMTDVPMWQIILSFSITGVSVFLLGYLSSRIYQIGVLMYGKPPKLRELAKIIKNEKRY